MDGFKTDIIEEISSNINLKKINLDKKKLYDVWDNPIKKKLILKKAAEIKINSMIMVKNQENKIEKAINSALKTSDHIFVFDTGSTDKTVDIVKSLNLKKELTLRSLDWVENYSYMRNLAASYIPDGWILLLDSDEIITPVIKKSDLKLVLAFLEFFFTNNDISIEFKQKDIDSFSFAWPERMYKKRKSIKFFGYVHEELRSKSLIRVQTQFEIHNSGTSENEISKFNKTKRYFSLSLKNYQAEPDYVKWVALMPFEEALNYDALWYFNLLKKYTKQIDHNKISILYGGYIICNYIQAELIIENDFEKTFSIIDWAIKKFPYDARFYVYKYILKNVQIKNQALDVIRDLQKDTDHLKSVELTKNNKWQPGSISGAVNQLENTLSSLLIKSDEYSVASELIKSSNQ